MKIGWKYVPSTRSKDAGDWLTFYVGMNFLHYTYDRDGDVVITWSPRASNKPIRVWILYLSKIYQRGLYDR